MRLARVLRGTIVIAASAAAVLALSVSPAAAASQHLKDYWPYHCSETSVYDPSPRPFDVYTKVPGGNVSGLVYVERYGVGYEVCVTGWVMDTRGDGKGAILYATYDWYDQDSGTWKHVARDRLTRADGYEVQEYYTWISYPFHYLRNFYVGVCRIAGGIVTDCQDERD